MRAAHTSSMVQDRKQCDANQTPAGGTDSTAAHSEPCNGKNREAPTDRRTDSQNKNQNTTTTQKGSSEASCTFSGIKVQQLYVRALTYGNKDIRSRLDKHRCQQC